MMTIGGDDAAPIGHPDRVRVTISCDNFHLPFDTPTIEAADSSCARRLAGFQGWVETKDPMLGHIWLCPACRRKKK